MHTKLTLRVEETLVEKAKAWAKTRRISLSQAVAEFFVQLPTKGRKEGSPALSPWTRRLLGVVTGKGLTLTEEALRQDYLDSLEAKYR